MQYDGDAQKKKYVECVAGVIMEKYGGKNMNDKRRKICRSEKNI